jgi:hypothetical protein
LLKPTSAWPPVLRYRDRPPRRLTEIDFNNKITGSAPRGDRRRTDARRLLCRQSNRAIRRGHQDRLAQFLKLSSKTMPDDVTPDAIGAVRQVNKRICRLSAGTANMPKARCASSTNRHRRRKRAERRGRHERDEAPREAAHAAPPVQTPERSRNTGNPAIYVDRTATSGSGYMRQICR